MRIAIWTAIRLLWSGLALTLVAASVGLAQDEYLDLGEYQNNLKSARTDRKRASALLSIGFHFLMKPGERVNDLKAARAYCDAAGKLARQLGSDSLQAGALFLSSQIQKENGDRAAAKQTLEQAISKYSAAGDAVGQGRALMEKRHYYEVSGPDIKERIAVVGNALALFKKAGEKRLQGDALLELGDLIGNDGDILTAIDYLKQADQTYARAGFRETQYLYSTLCIAHTVLGIYQDGLRYGLQAEKVALAMGDSSQTLTTIYNRIGITYDYLGDRKNAILFYKKGLSVAVRNQDYDSIAWLTANITNILITDIPLLRVELPKLDKIVTGGPGTLFKDVLYSEICQSYLLLGNVSRAKFFLDKLVEYKKSKVLTDVENIGFYRAAVDYYFHVKDFKLARHYLDKEEVLAIKLLQPRRLQAVYRSYYKLDSVNGDFKSALENLKKYKKYTDSTAAQMARTELQNLTVRYQVEKKNDEIKLKSDNIKLLTKDNRAQKALLQRASTIRNVTIAAILLLILLLAALYSRWTANRRNSALIANKNERLEQLVREKEWLVKEIHHRVKNNLQTIISLLETQAGFLQDDALSAVLDSQHRIHAMSLIHQKLYLVDSSTSIDMQSYMEELVHYLNESYGLSGKIAVQLAIDPVQLDVSRAIPVGLIVNEAVTNSMKYAFADRDSGMLKVSLQALPQNLIRLIIQDDGVGLPPAPDEIRPSSLGMKLMRGLTREIGGELTIDGRAGTAVRLTFHASESVKYSEPSKIEPEMQARLPEEKPGPPVVDLFK